MLDEKCEMQGQGWSHRRRIQNRKGAESEAKVHQKHKEQNHVAISQNFAVHDLNADGLELDIHGVEFLEASLQPMIRYDGRQINHSDSDKSADNLHHVPEIGDARSEEVTGHGFAVIINGETIADRVEGDVEDAVQKAKSCFLRGSYSGFGIATDVETGEAVHVGDME